MDTEGMRGEGVRGEVQEKEKGDGGERGDSEESMKTYVCMYGVCILLPTYLFLQTGAAGSVGISIRIGLGLRSTIKILNSSHSSFFTHFFFQFSFFSYSSINFHPSPPPPFFF